METLSHSDPDIPEYLNFLKVLGIILKNVFFSSRGKWIKYSG